MLKKIRPSLGNPPLVKNLEVMMKQTLGRNGKGNPTHEGFARGFYT